MAAATFVFNIAKGRVAELFKRVDGNDPANSAIIVVPLKKGGTAEQGQDYDNLKALLEDVEFDEQTAGGWSRVTLTDVQLSAPEPDDVNNRFPISVPSFEWNEPTAGNDVVAFLLCYDSDTTSGEDNSIIPLTSHARTITADGNDVVIAAGEVFRAT